MAARSSPSRPLSSQSAAATASDPERWPRGRVALLLALALALYATLMFPRIGATAGGSDSSGYLNNARLLAAGQVSVPARAVEGAPADTGARAPLGFRAALVPGQITPTYPTGFPLLVAAVASFTNWTAAPNLVVGAHLLAGLLLVYFLARELGLARPWAALAFLILAACPLYPFMGLQAMSDLPALVWVTAAIFSAWRARMSSAWALAAGFVFGFAVLIRPTNVLAFFPLAIALGFSWRRWLWLGVGGLPAAVFFARYNLAAYGAMLTTDYGNPSQDFSTLYLATTLRHYLRWLPILLTPLVLAALALPFVRRSSHPPSAANTPRPADGHARRLLGVWILSWLAFYSVYFFTHETWWYLRFLLPAFPALVVASLLVLQDYARGKKLPFSPWLIWGVVACGIVINGAVWMRQLRALAPGRDETSYVEVSAWSTAHLPSNAVIACMQNSGALFYYTDFALIRWDWLTPDCFHQLARATAAANRPLYAVLQDFERADALTKKMPGDWVQIDAVRNVTVWKLATTP